MRGGGVVWGSHASAGESYLAVDGSSAGQKQLQTWVLLTLKLRAVLEKRGERMLEKLLH